MALHPKPTSGVTEPSDKIESLREKVLFMTEGQHREDLAAAIDEYDAIVGYFDALGTPAELHELTGCYQRGWADCAETVRGELDRVQSDETWDEIVNNVRRTLDDDEPDMDAALSAVEEVTSPNK